MDGPSHCTRADPLHVDDHAQDHAKDPAARAHATFASLSAPGPLLPFDAPVAREPEPARAPEPVSTPPQHGSTAPTPTRWSPHNRPGPEFEHVLDARTPLLARAFESARPVDDEKA